MSQHHLTVRDTKGNTIKLVAGWDNSMLKRFFLTLRDQRRPAPDSEEELTEENYRLLYYDSDETRMGLPHIGDVELTLERFSIPFSDEHVGAFGPDGQLVTNPKLLPLLIAILEEQIAGGVGNLVRYWDNEPEPLPFTEQMLAEADAIQEWDRQFKYRYSHQDPHPTYSNENYAKWCAEIDEFQIVPYENWVRQQLVEVARLHLLTNL